MSHYTVSPFSITRDTAVGEVEDLLAQVCGLAYGESDDNLACARDLVERLQNAMTGFKLSFEHLETTASAFKLALVTLHERVTDFEARLEAAQRELDENGPPTCRAPKALMTQPLGTTPDAAEAPKSDVVPTAKGRRRAMTMFLSAVSAQAAAETQQAMQCPHAAGRLRIDTPFHGTSAVHTGTFG